jgi:biopolymer transport protein ExbD
MAEKNQTLDVWILETNTVYKAVPFMVVADWIQQGRLLDDDMVRAGGKGDWTPIAGTPALAAYLPRAEPRRADDKAEALEPVGLNLDWKRPPQEEDDDVDMVPLIDVSLVLLIFFMMTAAAGALGASPVPTPAVEHTTRFREPRVIDIDLNLRKERGQNVVLYSIRVNRQQPAEGFANLTSLKEAMAKLDEVVLKQAREKVLVEYNAHRDLEDGTVLDLLAELERRRDWFRDIYTGVREK